MKKLLVVLGIIPFLLSGQSLNIPAKKWGLSFGNSHMFTGLRFNFADKDVEQINGINMSIWSPKNWEDQSGSANGINLGLPVMGGVAYRNGINVGVLGAGATHSMSGINVGGLGIGAGNNLTGLNFGGLGLGAGNNVSGINIGGLGVGAGSSLNGFSFSVLGAGAGESVNGVTIAGLGLGAGGDVKGVSIAGLGMGAGGSVTGLNIGGLAVGAGGKVSGINLAGVAVGSGDQVTGLNMALVAIGAPAVKGISVAAVVGGYKVHGISVAPAYFKVGDKNAMPDEAELKGVAISLINDVKGENNGLCIGVFNNSRGGKGFQIGLLNHNAANPKGLRWLPFINANFAKKG